MTCDFILSSEVHIMLYMTTKSKPYYIYDNKLRLIKILTGVQMHNT